MFGLIQFEKGWMVSRHARRCFMVFSALSLVLGVVYLLMVYQPMIFDEKRQPFIVRLIETIIVLPSIVGGLCMFFGMEWYCLGVDVSRKPIRLLRALAMMFTFPFGQIVYYFLVYRSQTERVEMRVI
jgi:hypothetical protein